MEVAQIGRSICQFLRTQEGARCADDFHIDGDLVEAVCLAHDLGHPPVRASGRADAPGAHGAPGAASRATPRPLHLLTETMYQDRSGVRGMQPTRALLDGVLKYKTLYRGVRASPRRTISSTTPRRTCAAFVFGRRQRARGASRPGERLNAFKSVECQIMDWADDAAYSLNDIVDGVKAGFLTIDRIEALGGRQVGDAAGQRLLRRAPRRDPRGPARGRSSRRGSAPSSPACRLRERENFMAERTHRYRYELVVAPEAAAPGPLLQEDGERHHLREPAAPADGAQGAQGHVRPLGLLLAQLRRAGARGSCASCRPRSGRWSTRRRARRAKARQICDWLAGLTDGMIVRTYRRLFDPEFGSIRDLG